MKGAEFFSPLLTGLAALLLAGCGEQPASSNAVKGTNLRPQSDRMAPGLYEEDSPAAEVAKRYVARTETPNDSAVLADALMTYNADAIKAGVTDQREIRAGFTRAISPYFAGHKDAYDRMMRDLIAELRKRASVTAAKKSQ